MKRLTYLLAAAASCVFAFDDAHAQATGGGASLEEVVVTARKREETLQDVPLAITALTGRTLQEVGLADVRDLTRVVPNLNIVSAGSERSAVFVTIRGQSAADVALTTDSSVGLYLDGVNIPRNFGLSPGLIDMERVEVLKGPQGTLYGRNTTGGAISFVTRGPSLTQFGGYATVDLGNFGLRDFTGAVNLPIVPDMLAARLVLRNTTSDGYGRNVLGQRMNNDQNHYLRGHVVWTPTPALRVDLNGDYTKAKSRGQANEILSLNGFPPRPGLPAPTNALAEIAAESGLPLNGAGFAAAQQIWNQYLRNPGPGRNSFWDTGGGLSDGHSLVKAWGGGLNIAYDLNDQWQVKSTTGYRHFIKDTKFDLDGTPFSILTPVQKAHDNFSSEELQLTYSGQRLNTILGGFWSREAGVEDGPTIALARLNPNNPARTLGDVRNKSWAVYGQGDYKFTDQLTLTLGARWTEEDKRLVSHNQAGPAGACTIAVAVRDNPAVCAASFDNKFSDYSYLASLKYEPTQETMVYLRTARGFRGGGQNLRGSDALTFSAFAPEIATDYEIGAKSDLFDRRLRINAAAYLTKYKDIQRSVFVLNPGTGSVVSFTINAAQATIKGFEADATAQVTEDFSVSGTAGYIDAGYDRFTDATGDRSSEPFSVPKWTYSLTARYQHRTDIGKFVARADYSWQDKQVMRPSAIIDADVTQKAYGLLSGRLQLDIDRWNSTIALYGRNLTNQKYISGAVDLDASLGWNIGFQGVPRSYGIEFTKRFGAE